jgi:phytoene dehydrogenase-like protein
MADRSLIIIGAGIAGLSAGCYAQMNGYHTRIFELHEKPGGLCTSWKRKGYTFDGCIHWLVGSRPGSSLNRVWQELGAVQGREMVDHKVFVRVDGKDDNAFILYTNVDRLEQHMKALAPADVRVIEEFCNAVRLFTRFGEVVGDPTGSSGLFGGIIMASRMLPFIGALRRYSKISVRDFAIRFSDPFLREAFPIAFDLPDFPMMAMLMTLAWMHSQDAGYPIGGSLAFARAIERRYVELGGEIHYRSRVEEILVEPCQERGRRGDCAVGVRLADGTEHRADLVISAADGHATIFDMLGGRYVNDRVRGFYEELPIFQPVVQVSLGVARDLSNEPPMVSCPLPEPVVIAGELRRRMEVRHFCYDPTMAPPGRSVVVVMFGSQYDYWRELHEYRERYDSEKRQAADAVIAQLERCYPGLADQVEAVDVATPMTTERYTGNWQGSMEGWLITTRTMGMTMSRGMSKTLPGLKDFYMVGQWVEPGGGIPTAAMSGRKAIQMICKEDKRPFETQVP